MQPVANLLTWLGFTTGIGLHASGMLDVYLGSKNAEHERTPAEIVQVRKTFLSKWARYYGHEYLFFPLLSGPFFPKVLLGNMISEVARDVYAAAVIYCGHVGADDFPAGTEPMNRAEWYAMQVESGRDVLVPEAISILCGALDLQIEHHLFPRLPPNRLREIAPRVREICAAHGINHRTDSWPGALRSVLTELRRLSNRNPQPGTERSEQKAA